MTQHRNDSPFGNKFWLYLPFSFFLFSTTAAVFAAVLCDWLNTSVKSLQRCLDEERHWLALQPRSTAPPHPPPTPRPPTARFPKPWRRRVGKQMCASGGAALPGRRGGRRGRRRTSHSVLPQVTEHQQASNRMPFTALYSSFIGREERTGMHWTTKTVLRYLYFLKKLNYYKHVNLLQQVSTTRQDQVIWGEVFLM